MCVCVCFKSEVITCLSVLLNIEKKKTDAFDHFSHYIFSKYSEALCVFSDVFRSIFQFKQLIYFLT